MHTLKRALGGAAAIALLALSAGCEKKTASRSDGLNPELKGVARETAPHTAPAKPAPSRLSIQGPRSQSELADIYRVPAPTVSQSATVRRPVAAAPVEDERITADPSWDVNISREWRHIVVHHSASATGSAASFDKAHRERGWDGLGYHFVIGNGSGAGDGAVEVGYRWRQQMQGAHAGNAEYNQHGVGICLVGDFHNGGAPTGRQMASLRRLVRYLQVKTGVPTYEVIGHGNVPGKSTECPGRALDLAAFRASLGGGAIGVPIYIARENRPATSGTARMARSSSGAAVP